MAAVKRRPRPRTRTRRVVALIGGIPEEPQADAGAEAEIRVYGSAKEAGAGELRRLLASLKGGGIDEVWILFCWIGHSESRAIQKVCRPRGIPVRFLGGRGQVTQPR